MFNCYGLFGFISGMVMNEFTVGADPCVRPNAFPIHAFPVCYRADTWVRPYDG